MPWMLPLLSWDFLLAAKHRMHLLAAEEAFGGVLGGLLAGEASGKLVKAIGIQQDHPAKPGANYPPYSYSTSSDGPQRHRWPCLGSLAV